MFPPVTLQTWRDLKKKARVEGRSIRLARTSTGNVQTVPKLSEKNEKILGLIGKECAFGIGEPGETGLGVSYPELLVCSNVCLLVGNENFNFLSSEFPETLFSAHFDSDIQQCSKQS